MVAAVVLAGLTLFLGLTQTGSGDSTRVVGRVTSGPNGRPASKVWVTAVSGSQIVQTRTDDRGRYAFLTLLPGVYRLTAQPESAVTPYYVRMTGRKRSRVACNPDEENFVELSAGIEYLANLDLEAPCPP